MVLEKQFLWHLAYACVGRRDDYALQQENGRYRRAGHPVGYEALRLHLDGMHTMGTYVTDEKGMCHFAVHDADSEHGLEQLLGLQRMLASMGIVTYLELSRRGGHLWVFLSRLVPVAQLRRWLLPSCPAGVEFYPKRDWVTAAAPGSLVRLPLGVHRRSGRRYPFVELVGGRLVPVASGLPDQLAWLATVERVNPPQEPPSTPAPTQHSPHPTHHTLQKSSGPLHAGSKMSIRDWCRSQDVVAVIGRYVTLNAAGLGCCPFGWHHSDGQDSHPSLWAYQPKGSDLMCWYCHVWKQGGSLFDFLALYHGLDARVLWQRIQRGERF